MQKEQTVTEVKVKEVDLLSWRAIAIIGIGTVLSAGSIIYLARKAPEPTVKDTSVAISAAKRP